MDGFDLIGTTPTGPGKTGYLTLLMLVVRKIAVDKAHAIGTETFPEDPVAIVVCPTEALEEDSDVPGPAWAGLQQAQACQNSSPTLSLQSGLAWAWSGLSPGLHPKRVTGWNNLK